MSYIKLRKSPTQLIKLGKNIIEKHKADGKQSLLNNIDMKDFEQKIATADKAYEESVALRREAEKLNEIAYKSLGIHKDQKSSQPGDAFYYITQCRDILKGTFRGSLRKLGSWGFTVDDTAKKKKA